MIEHHLIHPSAPNGGQRRTERASGSILSYNDLLSPTRRHLPEYTEASTAITVNPAAVAVGVAHSNDNLLARLLAFLVLALLTANLFSSAAAELPARPEISVTPLQSPVQDMTSWQSGDYQVEPLAQYDVTARVLSARTYDSKREAEVSTVDFALGWGPMADRALLSQLNVQQRDRWYFVRWRNAPVKAQDVIANSANTHTIPASAEVAEQLAAVQPGDVVRLRGYLVRVSAEDGWAWTSSTQRFDTGDGSCEVIWVESVEIFADEPIAYASVD